MLFLPRSISSLKGLSTGTRTHRNMLLLPRGITSLKGLSHWNSAMSQHAPPPKEHRFTCGPLLLGLGHFAACYSSQEASLCLRASSTETRPLSSIFFLPMSIASLTGLSH
ncbi:hypothetical protein Adt_02868 [Abeliophyllum distichum]|uniref:Uncharacterized protein n=1 Tax=Abeliophyllum distichum TaxID=126358 RepID=A0ABD1VWW1_9LAMI